MAAVVAATPASALVVKTWNGPGTPAGVNESAPADDPGWANVVSSNPGGVYLGDQWMLGAFHTSAIIPGRPQEFAGGAYHFVPGSGVRLTNPTTFDNSSLGGVSDLYMWRITVDETTGLTPEELGAERLTIADRLPTESEVLTMFGRGRSRIINPNDTTTGQFHWTSTGNEVPGPVAAEHGFKWEDLGVLRWGTNRIGNPANAGIPSNQRDGLQAELSASGVNTTIGFVTRFDRGLSDSGSPVNDGSTDDEAQGAAGDSGSPAFWKDGDEWVLAGINHVIYQPNNQPAGSTWFGSHTGISDLSLPHYRDQIEALRADVMFSVAGDIDLDGVASGEIIAGVATGDLGVLVDNWLAEFETAGRISWMAGDLNQDAVVDLSDFVMMRSALGGSISTASLAALVGTAAIPEPTALALAAFGLASTAGRRRRPR